MKRIRRRTFTAEFKAEAVRLGGSFQAGLLTGSFGKELAGRALACAKQCFKKRLQASKAGNGSTCCVWHPICC